MDIKLTAAQEKLIEALKAMALHLGNGVSPPYRRIRRFSSKMVRRGGLTSP